MNRQDIEEQFRKLFGVKLSEINRVPAEWFYTWASQFPSQGLKWVDLKERLPEAEKEVFFDGGENPPAFGRIRYNKGKHPCIVLLDSSGEEEFEDIEDYERWLDESAPSQGLREEERKLLEKAHEITIEQLTQMQQDRNNWKEMCLQLAEEMRRAEWVSPLYDRVQELTKNQTPTFDESQGLRKALEKIAEMIDTTYDISPDKIRKIAKEALKTSTPDGSQGLREEEREKVKDLIRDAWIGAANAYRLYPDNKHTFSDYWHTLDKKEFESLFTSTLDGSHGKAGSYYGGQISEDEIIGDKINYEKSGSQGLREALEKVKNAIEDLDDVYINSHEFRTKMKKLFDVGREISNVLATEALKK